MAFPFVPLILGASTVVGGHLTRQTVTSGLRSGLGQFAGSLPFGAGYSLGTYLGFPKNYNNLNTLKSKVPTFKLMPYGYYPRYSRRFGYTRRSRYGRRNSRYGRYSRRYSRYYRRY